MNVNLSKRARLEEMMDAARNFRFCGPSDDPDEQTAVTTGYLYVLRQIQQLATPLLAEPEAAQLNAIKVEIDNIYSVYEARAELDALLLDIEAALESADDSAHAIGDSERIIDTYSSSGSRRHNRRRTATNPFFFSGPVSPSKLVGRKRVIRTLFSRVATSQSSLVTGQPRIGKSSLLLYVYEMLQDRSLCGNFPLTPLPIVLRPSFLDPHITPMGFWEHIVGSANEVARTDSRAGQIDSYRAVCDWLSLVREHGQAIVLLIDGLGGLLGNENLDLSFWGTLRSSANQYGLVLIVASRLSSKQLHQEIDNKYGMSGSPALNFAVQKVLYPFSYQETWELIENSLQPRTDRFTPKDKRVVWQLSGGHPFLAQLTSSLIWEGRTSGESVSTDGYANLIDEVVDSASPHFWDTWRYMSPTAQTIALMAVLREAASSSRFDTRSLDDFLQTEEVVRELTSTGLARATDQSVVLSSLCFGVWILRHQIGPENGIPLPEEFLRENRRVLGPITRKELNAAVSSVGKVYSELKATVLDIGSALARARLGLS